MCSAIKSLILFLLLVSFIGSYELAWSEEGLTLYYDFENETAIDKSGNKFDGKVSGAPNLIAGVVGKAWEFDGGTKIDVEFDAFKAIHPELSMRCFIRPKSVKGQQIIYDEGGAWTGFCVRIMDGELQFATVCCGQVHPPAVVISTKLPDTKDWIDIAAVFNKEMMILYINGKKAGEQKTEWQQLAAHGQAGGIGEKNSGDTAFNEGSGFFIGDMDEFRVYSRALQEGEVRAAVSSLDKLAVTWGGLKSNY